MQIITLNGIGERSDCFCYCIVYCQFPRKSTCIVSLEEDKNCNNFNSWSGNRKEPTNDFRQSTLMY